MNNTVPTIEDLLRKPKSVLKAMFAEAAQIAADAERAPAAREIAQKTMAVIRIALTLDAGP